VSRLEEVGRRMEVCSLIEETNWSSLRMVSPPCLPLSSLSLRPPFRIHVSLSLPHCGLWAMTLLRLAWWWFACLSLAFNCSKQTRAFFSGPGPIRTRIPSTFPMFESRLCWISDLAWMDDFKAKPPLVRDHHLSLAEMKGLGDWCGFYGFP